MLSELLIPAYPMFQLPLFKRKKVIILGIPYDSSQTFAVGSRFAPDAVRLASWGLEEFSFLQRKDVRNADASDWGNIVTSPGDFKETRKRINQVLNQINPERLLVLGGEHTITLATISWLIHNKRKKMYLVLLDAHNDFEQHYLGNKWSHACVLRRIFEILSPEHICVLGLRTSSEKALKELEESGIKYYTAFEIKDNESILQGELKKADVVSIDFDVFDPSFVPETSCPEPFGLDPFVVVKALLKSRPIYIDLVEITCSVATSPTAILAAGIARECILILDH